MNIFKVILTMGLLTASVFGQAAERIYTCEILNGNHAGYNINVIKSSSAELKINLLSSMNTLVTYTMSSSNLCSGKAYCVRAESKKKIEGQTLLMALSISDKIIQKEGQAGLMARASFDAFDLRNEPASVRVHDEDVRLICTK